MKNKRFSKVLALMVAAVMIFSALPLMAFANEASGQENVYKVDTDLEPAIPMNANTYISTDSIMVKMGDTYVSGATLNYEFAAGVTGAEISGNTIRAYEKGTYKLEVTDNGGNKETVYVVVKNSEETEWVLYDKTFEAGVLPEEWTIQTSFSNVYSGKITTLYTPVENPNPGLVPLVTHKDNNYQEFGTKGFFTLNDDVVSSFANYTIDVNAVFYNHLSEWAAGYIYGRTNTTNGLLTQDTEMYGFSFKNHLQSYGQPYYTTFTGGKKNADVSLYNGTDWIIGKNEVNAQYQAKSNNMVLKMDGNTLTVYEANHKTDAHTFTTTIPEKAGTVGLGLIVMGQAGNPGSAGAWFKIADIKITLNNTADDMPVAKEIGSEPEEPKPVINIIGEGTAKVDAVVGSENTYTVTLTPAEGYKVKLGSVVINGDKIIDTNDTGRVYTFATTDLDNTTIAVEYIADNGQLNTVMLGATINPELKGIRFGARTDSIMRAAQGATKGLLNEKINVGGVEYDVTEIGMILLPTQLLGGAELTVATDNVVRQAVTKIVGLTDDFADIAITLTGIPETMAEVQITSRMYIAYTDANGATQYVYSDTINRSYDDVLKASAQ